MLEVVTVRICGFPRFALLSGCCLEDGNHLEHFLSSPEERMLVGCPSGISGHPCWMNGPIQCHLSVSDSKPTPPVMGETGVLARSRAGSQRGSGGVSVSVSLRPFL